MEKKYKRTEKDTEREGVWPIRLYMGKKKSMRKLYTFDKRPKTVGCFFFRFCFRVLKNRSLSEDLDEVLTE
jgi:hypothetical protein